MTPITIKRPNGSNRTGEWTDNATTVTANFSGQRRTTQIGSGAMNVEDVEALLFGANRQHWVVREQQRS